MDFDEFTDTELFKFLSRGYSGEQLWRCAKACYANCKNPGRVGFFDGFKADSLITAFSWDDSPQGYFFWEKVHKKCIHD